MNKLKTQRAIRNTCIFLIVSTISLDALSLTSSVKQSILQEAMNPTPPIFVERKPAPETYAIKVVSAEKLTGYFVSPYGNDANSGSFKSPWKTIQAAIDKLRPGDILNILDGVYIENIVSTKSNPDQPITLRAVNAFGVTIDGGTIGLALNVPDDGSLRIEGLKLKNAGGDNTGQSTAITTFIKTAPNCTPL